LALSIVPQGRFDRWVESALSTDLYELTMAVIHGRSLIIEGGVMTRNTRSSTIGTGPKYPDVKVRLTDFYDAVGFYEVVAEVQQAMRHAGISASELSTFFEEVADDDEKNLLANCMRWVSIELI
jgi:hypothetical protein